MFLIQSDGTAVQEMVEGFTRDSDGYLVGLDVSKKKVARWCGVVPCVLYSSLITLFGIALTS